MDLAAEFRRLKEESNKDRDSRGRRYSDAARRLAIRYCREQRAVGRSLSKIAQDLGIDAGTLGRWLDPGAGLSETVPFRKVAVIEEGAKAQVPSIRVTLPSGLCVDGLQTNDVIELVKALA